MINPLHANPDFAAPPLTVQEAVDRLLRTLSQADKDRMAAMAEADLINLHFGLGAQIRGDFRLWAQGNRRLLADCQGGGREGRAGAPEGVATAAIHPDDAAMVIIRALWVRLRN